MDEAEILEGVALIAHDQAADIAEPGEEPFDLPAPLQAALRAAILGLVAFPSAPVWRDHLDAQLRKGLVQEIGVVGAIPDEPPREIR